MVRRKEGKNKEDNEPRSRGLERKCVRYWGARIKKRELTGSSTPAEAEGLAYGRVDARKEDKRMKRDERGRHTGY